MVTVSTNRPRNVDAPRAAAILYGDWGTSKVYVIGLAFAIAGYSSFWLIIAMCALTALVGFNYITICKHYPEGGGVYASVRQRSEVVSIIGAIALVGGYIVTAAISALSAFLYLRVPHPEIFAAASIFIVGALNFFGPRHTGGLAFLISVPAVIMVLLLGLFSAPYLSSAVQNLQPLSNDWNQNWIGFVGIVLALSGVEAVANSTGVMRLNPGSSMEKPSVSKTSTPAILIVMTEVCIFTALLGLAMHALPNLVMIPAPAGMHGEVNAPGHPGVRDYMLRYMGEFFVGNALGSTAGQVFGWMISIVFGFLLLSAVNTVIGALISISFLMSRDKELPPVFQRLNQFGVPVAGMIMAAIVPVVLVLVVKDMAGLADLYAIGVVGAIAANLGAASTDRKLALKRGERILMFVTFLIMAAIELTLLINKPHARVFAVTMLAAALVLRAIAFERARKKDAQTRAVVPAPAPAAPLPETQTYPASAFRDPLLVAVRGVGKTLDFAIEEARETGRALYVLFVREQAVVTQEDRARKWQQDDDARKIIDYAREKAKDVKVIPCYMVSDSAADTIVEIAATIGVSRLIVGAPQRSTILHFFRGNLIRQVSSLLPENIHLLVYA